MKNVNARLRATGEHHSILLLKTKQKEKSIRFFFWYFYSFVTLVVCWPCPQFSAMAINFGVNYIDVIVPFFSFPKGQLYEFPCF